MKAFTCTQKEEKKMQTNSIHSAFSGLLVTVPIDFLGLFGNMIGPNIVDYILGVQWKCSNQGLSSSENDSEFWYSLSLKRTVVSWEWEYIQSIDIISLHPMSNPWPISGSLSKIYSLISIKCRITKKDIATFLNTTRESQNWTLWYGSEIDGDFAPFLELLPQHRSAARREGIL